MNQGQDPSPTPGSDGVGAIVRSALAAFDEVTGHAPEDVSGVRKEGDGWSVLVEVLELERIPDTTSVMATYRVDLDAQGALTGFERLRRYTRGAVDRS
ncbi:MAG TPA: gas vesicle protein [Actinomycetes bacterium]|nr:gas vesicle protein [Actinomycetes bacterium]